MRLDVRHRLKPAALPASILARHAWKLGLGVVVAVLLTARGAGQVYTHPHRLATSVVPTSVPCGDIKLDPGSADTATWTATSSPYGTGSPYILPRNDPNLPTTDPNNPNCLTATNTPDEVHVPAGVKLVIDGSQGPVQIFSHGTGIFVNGGQLKTVSTDAMNTVIFDAEPDVASWDGINVSAADAAHHGNASLSFISIQHALTAITITSGATSSPDSASYGLTVRNSGIGPSYFDGIDATNTPISVTGRVDPLTSRPDGQFGTLNNIGSQGIKVTYDPGLPNYPAAVPDKALDVENMTFGSSVPFGETSCVPLQPCAAGSIGNDAIQGNFVTGQQPIKLDNNSFFRAGSYGLELTNTNNPTITNNIFTCNGSGSAKPVITCVGSGLRYSAIYLAGVTNLNVGASGLNNNKGQQNGLDAVALNGQVVSDLPWLTPWNDPNLPTIPPSPPNPPHALGYLVANGDLQLVNSKLTVTDGDVVKVKGGAILITNGSLQASSTSLKTFTSLRDNTVGIQACPSVFVQSCPSPLPANEWTGIDLVGSTGTVINANILFPTKAIDISGGQAALTGPDGGAYGLVVSNSRLGPTFSDSVAVNATPVYISASNFCRIDTIASDANYLQCIGAGPGDHGINASYTGNPRPAAGGGLKLLGNDIRGSTNEAIFGTALGGRLVDIENDTVEGAGTYGMHLVSVDNLTLKQNSVTGSGTGNPANPTTYAAIYLDGISKADFSGPISGNSGAGNGLDAIAFHGSTADLKPLNWRTVGAAGGALGYLIDGDLAVNGDLMLATNDYAPILGGAITMHNGTFSASGAVLSSLKEPASHLPSCGSVFVPKISGTCPAAAPGDWTGLILDPGMPNKLTNSEIRYAAKGISVGTPTGSRSAQNLTLIGTNVRNTASDGVATQSPLSITGGAFTGNGGRGIKVDLTGVTPSAAQPLVINGHTSVTGSGQDGILAISLGGHTVQVQDAAVDRAGTFGINLVNADHLTLTNNTVTNGAASYPAIYLNSFTGPFGTGTLANIAGNKGAANGIDAIAFNGTVTDDLSWQTARKTADPTQLLGYVLDNTLTMQAGHTLTVNAGDIVKVGNGGTLNLPGASLRADDAGSSAQKIFTSLTDNSAGVVACPSVLQSGCGPGALPAPGDWAGISLSGSTSRATVVNASVRYAGTGISITSGAPSTYGSSSFGLVVSRSTFGSTKTDGIFSKNTAVSVTNSAMTAGVHGVSVDLSTATGVTAVRLSGNRFMSTSAEAILGQALGGQPVWITDNRVENAGTFGMRLLNSNQLVLRNNNIVGSGGGPGAGPARFPAIYLPSVSADFARNVRGNVGSGNGLDSIAFDGTVTSSLTWITPGTNTTTKPLGYLLDGGLTLDGTTLTVAAGDVVKALGGPITINGGSLVAGSTSGGLATFTSLKDNGSGVVANAVSCPSVFVSASDCGQPQAGNWGGIVITDKAGQRGDNSISHSLIEYAITGISIDSGPITTAVPKLVVSNSTILHMSVDGINAADTPIDVESSMIGDQATAVPGSPPDIRAHGIIASFFSPASCPASCSRLTLIGNHIYSTGKDGIVANGLGGQPTVVNANTVAGAGTYGIRLVGADQLALRDNTVSASGGPTTSFRYPAIYLSGVKADFELASVPGAVTVAGNHGLGNGLDEMAIHGEATSGLTWLTTNNPLPAALPLPPVLGDHFGYVLDGGLTIDGTFTTYPHDVIKVLAGVIKVNGGLASTGGTFTSLKDGSIGIKACDAPDPTHGFDTVFIQRASGVCPPALSGDWGGVNIDATASTMDGAAIRYASAGVTINGASLQVTNGAFTAITKDAIDITNLSQANVVQGSTFSAITGTSINLLGGAGTPADGLSGDVFNGTGIPAVRTSGGGVSLTCSSVKSGGLSGDSHLAISDSDLLAYQNSGQTVADITNTASAPQPAIVAQNNLWNVTPNTPSTGPAPGQTVGNVDAGAFVTSQTPVLVAPPSGQTDVTNNIGLADVNADPSLPLGPGVANLTATHAYGVSDLTFTAAFNRRMLTDPSHPLVVWFNSTNIASPLDASSHLVIGNWDPTNPHLWRGTYHLRSAVGLTPATATNGLNHIFVSQGQSCVPDGPNQMAIATGTFKAALSPSAVAVSVTPISNPNYGSAVTLNANVTSNANAILDSTSPGGSLTAQIQFSVVSSTIQPASRLDPTRATGTATANVSLVTPAINAGSYTVTAQFPGDDQYTPAFGSFNPLVVKPAPTRSALVSMTTPGTTAASLDTVTLQATVSTDQTAILGGAGPNPGTADGAVAFSVAGSNPCSAMASSTSTGSLVVTCSTNLSTITGHDVTATFNPTVTAPTNFAASHATLTGTQTGMTSTGNGDGVHETLKATVTPNPSADGNVSFYDASTTPVTVLCSGATISGGVAVCSNTGTTYPALANHNVEAVYATTGSTFAPSVGALTQTTTTLTTAATTASGVTLTATVTPNAGATNPAGTVTFTDGMGAAISCGGSTTTPPDRVTLIAAAGNTSGASCQTDFSTATGIGGKAALQASYTPADATVFGASSTSPNVLGTSTGVQASPSPVPTGQAVTLTATVTHLGSGSDPTSGSVLFFDNGAKLTSCPSSNGDGSVNLTGGTGGNANRALCTLSGGLSPAGSHPLTAIYNPATPAAGNSTAFGSSLAPAQNLVVSQSTGTTLTTAATTASGVTLTATVTPKAGATNPTGIVAFSDGGGTAITCSNATTAPNIVTVSPGSGNTATASCQTDFSSTTGIGGRTALQASYVPADATAFGASSTTPNVLGTSTGVQASPSPVPNGQAVTLTATVTHLSGGSDPTSGSVLFFDNGTKLTTCTSSSTVNGDGSITLNGVGPSANQAACTLSSGLSAVGTHPMTAIYNPATGSSAAFGSSLSPAQNLVVSQSTGTTLTTAATTASGVTLTATVTPNAGATNPAGTVTFTDGAGVAISCSGSTTTPPDQVTLIAAAGNTSAASCQTDFSSSTGIGGKTALRASYTPADATVFGASSTSPNVTGSKNTLTLHNAAPVSITATVTDQGLTTNPTTGTVLFFDNGSLITGCAGSNVVDHSVGVNGSGVAVYNLASPITSTDVLRAIYNPPTPAAASSAAFGSSLTDPGLPVP